MKKSFRKAMISTICMLIVGVMSLTGVTYAWFTAGTQATVSSFNVDVTAASGGLLIAAPGSNADTALSFGAAMTPALNVASGDKLHPVSTAGELADGALKFFKAELGSTTEKLANIAAVSTNKAGTDAYWVSFDIYVNNATNTAVQNVYLDAGTTVLVGGNASASALATRIAVVQHGHMNLASLNNAALTAGNYQKEADSNISVKIYEPNATTHTDLGNQDWVAHGGTAGGKYTYNGIKAVPPTEIDRITSPND